MESRNPVVINTLLDQTKFTFEDYQKWEGYWELIDGQAHKIQDLMESGARKTIVSRVSAKAGVTDLRAYPQLKFGSSHCFRPLLYFKFLGTPVVVEWCSQAQLEKVNNLKVSIYQKAGLKLIICTS